MKTGFPKLFKKSTEFGWLLHLSKTDFVLLHQDQDHHPPEQVYPPQQPSPARTPPPNSSTTCHIYSVFRSALGLNLLLLCWFSYCSSVDVVVEIIIIVVVDASVLLELNSGFS